MTEFTHPVVAVGASAGGVEALKDFVSCLPNDSPASFVVLQHLAPDHETQLPDILRRATSLPVLEAQQDTQVEPGHIYVLMPDRYVTIVDHGLFVEAPTEPRGLRLPIDFFMRSLADTAGEQAVGVILSGTGSDGTLGLRAIKGAGGVALAQSPETALYDGMPTAAIDAGVVDQVGDIESLCKFIGEIAESIGEPNVDGPYTRRDVAGILALMKARTGHDFAAYKEGTIGRRVKRRMNLLRYDTVDAYLEHLRDNADELRQLFDDLLINVTCFFRDEGIWERVAEDGLSQLGKDWKDGSEPIRIWVPACSTGEEAYTLAILMEEECAKAGSQCEWQIFATDLDTNAVAHGREGLYADSIADDVSPERLRKFFKRESGGWRVKKSLREKVVFANQNVLTDPPFSRLNMISCRNLLIYLDHQHQTRLIETFHFALQEDGYLLLGTSENTTTRERIFRTIDNKAHLYQRLPGRSTATLGARTEIKSDPQGIKSVKTRSALRRELFDQVSRSLLKRYAPAAVAIRQSGDIAYFYGPVRRFLELPEGEPSNSIYDLLPPSLRSRAREAQQLVAKGETTSRLRAKMRLDERPVTILVECEQIRDDDDALYLLTFIEHEDEKPVDQPPAETDSKYLSQLEGELAIVREDLQTTVEELETSNEELKASHEEAVAANEELQSTNEELETSREELQSLNEELITVNNQLEEKITEVERSTDDMRNLLTSTRLPVLFLDPNLKISGFTPTLSQLVEVRETDMGRPVTELAFRVDDEDLIDDIHKTLEELGSVERTIEAENNCVYLRRIQPYRTSDERISGVVVTYNDISQQAATASLLRTRERQQRIIAELGQTALGARDLSRFFDDLCSALRIAMMCDYAKVLRYEAETDDLLMVAGIGWRSGLVGSAKVSSGVGSQGGYTLQAEAPVLVEDGESEDRFDYPDLLTRHNVVSGISCPIKVGGKPWGVIGLHDREAGKFREEDLIILQAAANIAASTIMQIERENALARESLMLSLAVKTADMGIWFVDPENDEATWDERLRQIIGVNTERGRPKVSRFMDLIHEDDREMVRGGLARTIQDGEPFESEFRLVRPDGEVIWLVGRGERLIDHGRTLLIGINSDITERKANEEQNRFMMRELDHRVKNLLAIILSIAKITQKSADSTRGFVEGFEKRLHAMARTHSLLADGRWNGAHLETLIQDELAHTQHEGNITIEGPDVAVLPAAAQALAMALHELCTNALKYGSLRNANGQLDVRWDIVTKDGQRFLDFEWRESDGPKVTPPAESGFGTTVIERILMAQLGAETRIRYEEDGLIVQCRFPMERIEFDSPSGKSLRSKSRSLPNVELQAIQGAKILVLDDEWLLAEQQSQMLISAGAEIVGPFNTIDDARKALATTKVDLAILDYNIGGEPVDRLIDEVSAKDVPILVVSGYGSSLTLPEHLGVAFLPKPVSPASLVNHAASLIGKSRADTTDISERDAAQ